MKKILWYAPSAPLPTQILALEKIHGEKVDPVPTREENAERLARQFREGGYDDLVVVAPAATLQRVCEQGLRPLFAETRSAEAGEKPDFVVKNRRFCFVQFRRLVSVGLDLRDPGRLAGSKILVCSRHQMTDEQIEALNRLAGQDVRTRQQNISEMSNGFVQAGEIADLFHQSGADEMVLVAPYPVFEGLIKMDVYPLYAEMRNGMFKKFWRVHGLKWEFED